MNKGALYLVATPIGNLDDITSRAQQTLEKTDVVLAEDTRHSQKLLNHLGLRAKKLVSLHQHNERQKIDLIIEWLVQGKQLALISDAGTPLISDPGSRLVKAVRSGGYDVIPVPGCCAAIAALSASGLSTTQFHFVGFLSTKSAARCQHLLTLKKIAATVIIYESPKRLLALLTDIETIYGADHRVVVARELTKCYEQFVDDEVTQVRAYFKQYPEKLRGEIVVLLEAQTLDQCSQETLRALMKTALESLSIKAASTLVAQLTGDNKKQLYEIGLGLKKEKDVVES